MKPIQLSSRRIGRSSKFTFHGKILMSILGNGKRMKKTSRAFFERFKESFIEWQHKLGLTQYEIVFHLGVMDDAYVAQVKVREMDKVADVCLAKKLSQMDYAGGAEPLAKHEAIHLLLHRMKWLGEARYIENNDLQEEWESLVRRLEKVL